MTHRVPPDHDTRFARAELALDGLSIGDAFGQRFFVHPDLVDQLIAEQAFPREPWGYTDDTEMALAICEVLANGDGIDRDLLAKSFARRYVRDPARGYGGGAHTILNEIAHGIPWSHAAGSVFDGQGSMGNGGAMRVAPVGAYFADDLDAVVTHARASAEVTHAHPDGQSGAIAVALAAAYAWQRAHGAAEIRATRLLDFVFARVPDGATRDGLAHARKLAMDTTPRAAAAALGSGALVLSSDTVPFALWCAERHLADFEHAMWTTVAGLGDRDTTCAIVGGIVALSVGRESIPANWLAAREPLQR